MMRTENPSGNSSSSRAAFGHPDSKPVRHGSNSKADFEALTMSQKEISDEDARKLNPYWKLPQLAVFGRGASLLPLGIVLLVTAVKDAYEDWRRHRSDKVENNSDPTGVAYVQTLNLDGESNLKTRNIYGFQATMEIDGKRLSLGSSNIVLRGCELKNTSCVVGVAVYCGRETKAMLNNSGAPSKRSRLETQMNSEIIMLSVFLVALCTVTSVCAGVWLRQNKNKLNLLPYYRKLDVSKGKEESYQYYGWGVEIVFTFLMSVIVFQIMIPISLYISMELVRVGQAYFMIKDSRLYDEATNSKFQCRALNINEDLGQIKYVFSDKTGTLTENKMEFQCASIWGVDYSSAKAGLENEQLEYSLRVNGKVLKPKMKHAILLCLLLSTHLTLQSSW
ncbi:unnamed protein product [Vicia faba]|uniref:Phospholipid-transporting ATPase n=1 Tax=Vicia faba TaxID=3906 RepID=A0AAV1A8Y3_VICFA|nr:unnamed protein product [Vicia faba]